ncbi:MAG: CDP-diacylglycerol--serine O-phosphatidyltransferase [Ignavibacteriae bacterium]|nr:CDP-diacylglycerol--serine O-phosphatidyltransferase [Ignavibacteriota bacterium]
MRITRAVVPSLFTVLNMFCGFNSIIYASQGEFIPAAWLIFLAAAFDALDGMMARLTKSSSEFGVEIDSLSDVVSFGAAPAFLSYQISLQTLGTFGILISSLLMVFGGLRLARFNTQLVGFDKDHFVGLPIPASGLSVASFVITYYSDVTGHLDPTAEKLLPWICVVLALLMVSKVKYDTLPRISRRAIRKEPWKFVFAVLAVIVVAVTGASAILPLFGLFVALGIIRYIGSTIKHLMHHHQKLEEEEAAEPSSSDI